MAKNQKILNVGKIRNYDEETVIFREKQRYHLLKSLDYKIGKAENIPAVAGRLVIICQLKSSFLQVSSN